MDMNHLIGQRFNLISKSDIRYVGTLHEINPEASTIALQNVVSFGTEGRRGSPAEEIPPSNSIYEYIVFRGSDVKDISIAEDKKENAMPEPPQMPDDPAILGSMPQPGPGPQGIPQPQQPPQQPHQQQPQGPRPPPPGYPQQPQFQGYYPGPYGPRYPPFPPGPPGPGYPAMPYGAPPGWYPPPGQGFPQPPGQFPPPMPIGPPGQHHTPPTQRAAPSGPRATSELPVSDRPVNKPGSQETASAPVPPPESAPTPPVESKPTVAEAVKAPAALNERAPPTGPRGGRAPPVIPITTPSRPPVPAVANAPLASANANNNTQGTAQAAITEATRAATAAVAAAMAKLPQPNGQKPQYADPGVEGVTRQMSDMKPYDSNRAPRGGQHTRGRGGHRNQYPAQNKKVEVPTTDYDFQTANAKFNKQDMVKEAIASGSPLEEIENPAEDLNSVEPPATTQNASMYSKSSFFDNISSESRDREEGTGARAVGREWRGEEEKRNIETFGQGSVDGYRSSYRGRGRGRGFGRGRGGYGRGYGARGRGGRNMSQSTGVPTPN
ncbi:Scd6-like Sm domain-containing protein [Aspergillus californicus]